MRHFGLGYDHIVHKQNDWFALHSQSNRFFISFLDTNLSYPLLIINAHKLLFVSNSNHELILYQRLT